MKLEVTEAAKELMAERGYDAEYGARPLKRAIQRLVENPLSSALLRGSSTRATRSRSTRPDGELAFRAKVTRLTSKAGARRAWPGRCRAARRGI